MRITFLLAALLFCLSATGCSEQYDSNDDNALLSIGSVSHTAIQSEASAGYTKDISITTASVGNLQFTRYEIPDGYIPMGMLNPNKVYLLDESCLDVLWSYDFFDRSFTAVIDYRNTELGIAKEIAMSENWLIWMETETIGSPNDGTVKREVRLKASNIATFNNSDELLASSKTLDVGYITSIEGFFMPFDSLSIDGDNLAYRYSAFAGGQRDSEVRLANLIEGSFEVLDRRRADAYEYILSVDMAEGIIVWDVQHRFTSYSARIPAQELAVYSLLKYDLAKMQLPEYVAEHLSRLNYYSEPKIYGSSIFCIYKPFHLVAWSALVTEQFPIHTRVIQRTKSSIAHSPLGEFAPSELIGSTVFLDSIFDDVLQEFREKNLPISIEVGDIYIGKRFLSWQSNIANALTLMDLRSYSIIELPHFFGEYTLLEEIRMTAIAGFDADYLIFAKTSNENERYLLRIE